MTVSLLQNSLRLILLSVIYNSFYVFLFYSYSKPRLNNRFNALLAFKNKYASFNEQKEEFSGDATNIEIFLA